MKDNELKRWRMILGKNDGFREGVGSGNGKGIGDDANNCEGDGEGPGAGPGEGEGQDLGTELTDDEQIIDQALETIYNNEDKKGDLSKSHPRVAKWLGEIRNYFPKTMVQIIQKDAIKKLNLLQLLAEPEMLENIVPDVNLAATLLTLSKEIPEKNRDAARKIVKKVADDLSKKLYVPMYKAISGAINRSSKKRISGFKNIDWKTTIKKNLKNYQPDYKTIIPEIKYGYSNKRHEINDVIICIDESASMFTSVVYSGIYGSVLSTITSIKTRLIAFDTKIVDLTSKLSDPVEVLFGLQLGGGTDINKALSYCQKLVESPNKTYIVIITDLEEGGNVENMKQRFSDIKKSGVEIIVLLSLNDDGAPNYNHNNAKFLSDIGIPCFACTPDIFPNLMAAAFNKEDIMQFWRNK